MMSMHPDLPDGMAPSDELKPWIDALKAIDEKGNKGPLIELLKSKGLMSAKARFYLADLLTRYNFKKPWGGRATPAYTSTTKILNLNAGKLHVQALMSAMSREDGWM